MTKQELIEQANREIESKGYIGPFTWSQLLDYGICPRQMMRRYPDGDMESTPNKEGIRNGC